MGSQRDAGDQGLIFNPKQADLEQAP